MEPIECDDEREAKHGFEVIWHRLDEKDRLPDRPCPLFSYRLPSKSSRLFRIAPHCWEARDGGTSGIRHPLENLSDHCLLLMGHRVTSMC